MRKFLLTIFFVSITAPVLLYAQSGYQIKVKIKNSRDSMLLLGHYFANMKLVDDTAWAKTPGNFIFEGKEALDQGMYIIVPQNRVYFEILIGADQHFSLETDTIEPVKNMKFNGSTDNQVFFQYLEFLNDLSLRQKAMQTRLQDVANDSAQTASIRKELKALDKEVLDYQAKMKTDYPEAMINVIAQASREPILPEPWPLTGDGKPDSVWAGRYYLDHYWDSFDFTDARLLRTPIYHNKLDAFFTKVLIQHHDTLIKYADWLIEQSRPNKEMFRYTIQYITLQSERSQIMGHDAVFVHMVKKYYQNDEAYWVTPEVLEKMKKKAAMLDKLLLGKRPPEMILVDTLGKLQYISKINAKYLILYFWDPDCGHCRKESPQLLEYYHKIKPLGVEIAGICISREHDKWINYIREHDLDWINLYDGRTWTNFKDMYDVYSTPVIYVLNQEKEVIAKRLNLEQLEGFMENEFKRSGSTP